MCQRTPALGPKKKQEKEQVAGYQSPRYEQPQRERRRRRAELPCVKRSLCNRRVSDRYQTQWLNLAGMRPSKPSKPSKPHGSVGRLSLDALHVPSKVRAQKSGEGTQGQSVTRSDLASLQAKLENSGRLGYPEARCRDPGNCEVGDDPCCASAVRHL
jgi:hypothetical protein